MTGILGGGGSIICTEILWKLWIFCRTWCKTHTEKMETYTLGVDNQLMSLEIQPISWTFQALSCWEAYSVGRVPNIPKPTGRQGQQARTWRFRFINMPWKENQGKTNNNAEVWINKNIPCHLLNSTLTPRKFNSKSPWKMMFGKWNCLFPSWFTGLFSEAFAVKNSRVLPCISHTPQLQPDLLAYSEHKGRSQKSQGHELHFVLRPKLMAI